MTIADEKAELRRRMRAIRAAIPDAERAAQSEAAADRLLTLPEASAAQLAFVFNAFGSEIATGRLIERLAGRGVDLALPRLIGGLLEPVAYRPGDPVAPSTYGALEPRDGEPVDPDAIDLVVTPGLAFDTNGYRVGYGGGYYDGFFRRAATKAARIGLCFDVQIVDAVPHDDRDEPLHAVVSELRVVRATAS
jgi:5-formyltetrahydrofolate cyclo-ligase